MEALDGNAIGGALWDAFGTEMTAAHGACAHCRTSSQIAELSTYLHAPGAVVRCRHCGEVVMVLVTIGETTRADVRGFELADPSG